jgi:hypothetical protein
MRGAPGPVVLLDGTTLLKEKQLEKTTKSRVRQEILSARVLI